MRFRNVLVLVTSGFLLVSCGPNSCSQQPTITVQNSPGNILTVNGQGFSNDTPCAQLGLIALPKPSEAVAMGTVGCSGGTFKNFNWPYYYATQCDAGNTVTAVVVAVDIKTNSPTFAPVQIPWGPTCALAGTCGKPGQLPCPSGCLDAALDPTSNTCVPCGTEGLPVCQGTNMPCQAGFNPNFQNGQTLCTALCGYAIGSACTLGPSNPFCSGNPPVIATLESACVTQQSLPGGNNQNVANYTCYGSQISSDGQCNCVPTTNNAAACNTSPVYPNPGAGECLPGPFTNTCPTE